MGLKLACLVKALSTSFIKFEMRNGFDKSGIPVRFFFQCSASADIAKTERFGFMARASRMSSMPVFARMVKSVRRSLIDSDCCFSQFDCFVAVRSLADSVARPPEDRPNQGSHRLVVINH